MNDLNLKILSYREEQNDSDKSVCYLCETSLENYVKSIPDRYTDYDIQRGIITNVYLDRLTETILRNKFIPPIVLIVEADNEKKEGNLLTIAGGKYKILDGLQRTYRIKAIYNALQLYIKEKCDILDEITKFKLSKQYKEKLKESGSDINILWTIVQIVKDDNLSLEYLESLFTNFSQWFEIWTSLNKKEQINKMLVLNAGHKPMDIKHQLELLFLNIIPEDKLENFIRAKDVNSSFFYNKKEEGELHLSHFISALLSFHNAKPITVDSSFLHKLQDNLDLELEKLKFYFENTNLEILIDFTKNLDVIFKSHYQDIGLEWLGRETILVGLFAAFGRYFKDIYKLDNFESCLNDISTKIQDKINIFDIEKFNKCKTTSIDITKVNIGNIFKYTTFNAMILLLSNHSDKIDWDYLFKYGTKEYHVSN